MLRLLSFLPEITLSRPRDAGSFRLKTKGNPVEFQANGKKVKKAHF